VTLWGLLLPLRQQLDLWANLRPARLLEGVPSPLAGRPGWTCSSFARTPRASTRASAAAPTQGLELEVALETSVFTRVGDHRVLVLAFELAQHVALCGTIPALRPRRAKTVPAGKRDAPRKYGGVGVAHPRHEAWSPSGRESEGRQRTMAAATTPLPRTADAYPVRCRPWAKLAATYEERQGDAVKRSLRSAWRKKRS
jgi:hypothetical protein